MDNKVVLTLDKAVTRLAGYSYGKEIYNEQVKGKLDFSQKAYIEFPDRVIKAASSFVQGFFEEIIKCVGIDGINSTVILLCGEDLKKSIISNL